MNERAIREETAWADAWRPAPDETAYEITELDGEIPRELCGTLYRNGPSQRRLPQQGYAALHFFDGDALVHALRIEDGGVHYTGRFARNQAFLYQEENGPDRQDFYNFRVSDPDPEAPPRVAPNTNIVYHGGKLLALVEADLPFELDPRSLASLGTHRFRDPMLGMSTSAHPKIDGRTGQMLIHGYQPVEPYVQLYTIEPDGSCSLAEAVETPYPVMMHDMAITENYVILLLCPITFDLERGAGFRDWLRWEPEKGLKFGIRPRRAGGQVRWFEAPTPAFIFHSGNAYERDGKIFMDACSYLDGGALLKQLEVYRSGERVTGAGAGANPFLYEFDLSTGDCRETQLDDGVAEFPRIDDRRVGHENRYGYALMGESRFLGPETNRIVKTDRRGGPSVVHECGAFRYPGEPIFVPRTPDAEEDDGFVLVVVYDGRTHRSDLVVLDARAIDKEPLAVAHLEHRVPLGFHGNFAAGI